MADSPEEINLSKLSMPELLAEQKKRKTSLLAHQFIIGFMAGVAIFFRGQEWVSPRFAWAAAIACFYFRS